MGSIGPSMKSVPPSAFHVIEIMFESGHLLLLVSSLISLFCVIKYKVLGR